MGVILQLVSHPYRDFESKFQLHLSNRILCHNANLLYLLSNMLSTGHIWLFWLETWLRWPRNFILFNFTLKLHSHDHMWLVILTWAHCSSLDRIHQSNLGLLFHAHRPDKQPFSEEEGEAARGWFRVFQGAFDMIKSLCSHMGLIRSGLNKGKWGLYYRTFLSLFNANAPFKTRKEEIQ